MRPLVIVCEQSHAEKIREGVSRHCHPRLKAEFVLLVPVDVTLEGSFAREKDALLDWLKNDRRGATDKPLICATPAAGAAAKVRAIGSLFDLEVKQEKLGNLTAAHSSNSGPPPLQRLLNQCGLSLRTASASMLGHWTHGGIDRKRIDDWIEQFALLGPYKWIGETILSQTRLIEPAELGDMLTHLPLDGAAAAVNRDPRGGAKSGEIVQNMLGKRDGGVTIYSSPADAIERSGASRIVVFEDGLWSGTEAMGIIESLLGERPPESLKTEPLKDKATFGVVEVTLAYGIATDYGTALVSRFLKDRGLSNVKIWSNQVLPVAAESLLRRLEGVHCDLAVLRHGGPPEGELVRPVLDALAGQGHPDAAVDAAKQFVRSVGRQLWDNYLGFMEMSKGWSPWPEAKREAASLGMHGLALTHGFGHSIPRAALPLLWGRGPVTVGAKRVDWTPLFPNAY